MKNRFEEVSPNAYARTGGVLYLVIIIIGFVNVIVIRGGIIVPNDVAATTTNLKSKETIWRIGIANELLMAMINIWLSFIIYYLTKPVSRNLALIALFFGLIATTIGAAYSLELLKALFPLGNADYLKAFTVEQLYAYTNLSIKSQGIGFAISLLFFGPFFILTGCLLYKSGYIPKIIGVLYFIPGFSYFISSMALILAPNFGGKYYFIIAGPAIIGELSLSLWLLIKGVNSEKWSEIKYNE